jgi:hypothetical protein
MPSIKYMCFVALFTASKVVFSSDHIALCELKSQELPCKKENMPISSKNYYGEHSLTSLKAVQVPNDASNPAPPSPAKGAQEKTKTGEVRCLA